MMKIFVHGLGQTPDCWSKTLAQFETNSHCVCPNLAELLKGHEATYINLYNAFSFECHQYKAPLDLCALSLGSVLALNYALEYPERVRTLVLIAPQYKMPKRLLQIQNLIFRFMPNSMFNQMGFGKQEFLQLCKSMMELDFTNSLQKISCPTLVVCGEKDSANKNAAIKLTQILPNAKLQILDGAAHEVNTEAPEELAKVLRKFYDSFD